MSKGRKGNKPYFGNSQKRNQQKKMTVPNLSTSLLDVMKDGREFESLLHHQFVNVDPRTEIRRSIKELQSVRGNYVICYVTSVSKPKISSVSIDTSDDLPFRELVNSVPADVKEIDLVLVTPGGYASQVAKFVGALRPRFDKVNFILLKDAMSAGTIFSMSGDEIVMSPQSFLGPIDPQIRNKDGQFVPIQSIITLIEEIRDRGQAKIDAGGKPDWSDLELLRNLDPKDVGRAINASQHSIDLVKEFLYNHKFKNWVKHSNGDPVTDAERKDTSESIAKHLCDNSEWKIHGHAITRETAWDICKLKITHSESVTGLDRAMKRMWALFYWFFENSKISKVYLSEDYSLFKQDPNIVKKANPKKAIAKPLTKKAKPSK